MQGPRLRAKLRTREILTGEPAAFFDSTAPTFWFAWENPPTVGPQAPEELRYLFNQGGSGCHSTAQCEQDEAAIGKVDLALGGFAATLLAPEIELGEVAVSGVEDTLSFFDGTSYTPKVLQQMQGGAGEFHSFPESVTAFEGNGTVSTVTGGDGAPYEMLRIPGSYQSSSGNWYDGYFEFMKDSDGAINHRYFNPSTGSQ